MFKPSQNLRKLVGYALGVAFFALAGLVTQLFVEFRNPYPYAPYFLASVLTCYWIGQGPANLVAALAAAAVYLKPAPSSLLLATAQTPLAGAVTLLVLLLCCNALIGSLKRSRDRLTEERERYARLAESHDVLYRELQHRISNNITAISSLLLLQRQTVSDAAARRALGEASARINLIARVQRQLHDRSGAPAPFRSFAEELLTAAVAAAGGDEVQVEIEGGEAPLDQDQATPVSLVLLECVNNALEHAFGPGRGGKVRVSLFTTDGRTLLTVSDDGRGLPDGFDPAAAQSLGLKIVHAMARQLNGDFSIRPGAPGSVCRLCFPAKA